MKSDIPSFYQRWRELHGWPGTFRETPDGHPPERLLQAIWSRQRLRRDELISQDGRRVRVLHPGFWNREPGPDFRGAVLQFDNEPPVAGDVEVDLRSDGWRSHGHYRNPSFADVVLHVVWEDKGGSTAQSSTLVINDRLDATLGELNELLEGELPPPLTESQQGRCQAPLQSLDADKRRMILTEAARVRLESRASQLRARARQVGWEQSLIEGLMRALGYKHNAWPMQRLGELIPILRDSFVAGNASADPLRWQALLLGTSGLLPKDVKPARSGSSTYLRRVWDVWWRERDRFDGLVLPVKVWRMAGIRPANHPQRRLALAARWLATPDFFKRLEAWFKELVRLVDGKEKPPKSAPWLTALCEVLDPGRDPFWSRHWTLRSQAMIKPQPLIGPTRTTDLAVNVILPWFFVRAREGRNYVWSVAAEKAWLAWPAAEDNAVLRLARARLFGNSRKGALKTAADQQGLLQIVRDFCDHSNAICEHCRFPGLVTDWSNAGNKSGDVQERSGMPDAKIKPPDDVRHPAVRSLS